MNATQNRRPLRTRSMHWPRTVAHLAARAGLTPNMISVAGIGFAAVGACALVLAGQGSLWWWPVAALCIQLRLLANLIDGLVAVEGGKASPTGALFNEVPDRIEDALLLVAAGFAAGMPLLGCGAALAAMATAYIRLLAGSLGFAQDFSGPMAKQHRMAMLTLATLIAAALPDWPVMTVALGLMTVGTVLTCVLRLMRIADALEAK